VSAGYATLELDRTTGGRGRRQDHVRRAACELFGCEDALAVNNNAAAVFLAMSALARGRRVPVSRGELVAIGGSFRIPEILEASGAELVEVGTTNRTTIEDYRKAVSSSATALLLTVHPSNYEIRGYTERPRPAEIAALAREAKIPWIHDQGTGCVVPLEEFGVPGEPTVASCLADGADLVTFSGDKLFCGPQAGFAVGRRELVSRLAAHPVARVVRPGKMALAALGATLSAWKRDKWREFPVYRAAAASLDELERRAEGIRAALEGGGRARVLRLETVPSFSLFGGGTSPEKTFASRALAVQHPSLGAEALLSRLRGFEPPVIARIEEDRVLLDLRSIQPDEDQWVKEALAKL
jgi:L-seryl-tRNA(Ser) seleniumtransferase